MNTEFISYCIKSVKRRWKSIFKTALSVFLAFSFVAGIMLFKTNMYEYQIQSAKHKFGSWIVMLYDSNLEENKELKNHPYLNETGKATVDNYVFENDSQTDIKVGYMDDDFIRIGNISLQSGSMPQNDDEAAIELDTLLKLNQGTQLGQEIHISVRKGSNQTTESIEKTYKLTGILNNYTNLWCGGNYIPGIIVTQGEGENINRIGKAAYIYSSDSYIDGNYNDIYDGLKKKSQKELIYNSSVYDYEPWGGGYIYDYMYVLLMLIGVSAVVYQILMHDRKRKHVRSILTNLGAKRIQLMAFSLVENIVIVTLAAIAGLFLSIFTGKIVCTITSYVKGIQFFNIKNSIYVYVFIMLIVCIGISMIACIIENFRHPASGVGNIRGIGRNKSLILKTGKNKLVIINRNNYISQTQKRLNKSHGALSAIAVRVFALAILVIIAGCVINSIKAYKQYLDISDMSDIIAFNRIDSSTNYVLNYADKESRDEYYYTQYSGENGNIYTRDSLKAKIRSKTYLSDYNKEMYDNSNEMFTEVDAKGETRRYFNRFSSYTLMCNIKKADTPVYKDIDKNMIGYINSIDGVEDISYGYFETARTWAWNNMDYNKLGVPWYLSYNFNSVEALNDNQKTYKYLFATEYVENDNKLYDILKDITGKPSFDEEAFNNGDISVVFVDENIDGDYDDTLSEGMDINLMKYYCNINGSFMYDRAWQNSGSYNKALSIYIKDKGYSSYKSETDGKIEAKGCDNYVSDLKNKPDFNKIREEYIEYLENNYGRNTADLTFFCRTEEEQLELVKQYYYQRLRKDYSYILGYEQAATTKAWAVVKLSDEIKDRLKEYIPEFGQYTMIASTKLLQRELDNQNQVLKDYFQMDVLPDELSLDMSYNQIRLRYSMNSLYSGTVNTVNSYMLQTGWGYHSYSEEKDEVKRKTFEAIILYVFTAAVSVGVYIIISVLMLMSRIEKYKNTMTILRYSGADKSVIFKIYMKECFRESLYCIILMPLMLLIYVLVIRHETKVL